MKGRKWNIEIGCKEKNELNPQIKAIPATQQYEYPIVFQNILNQQ